MTEIRAKQCSLTVLLISQSFLNRFGCFWARFKRGGLENPYPYPHPCLPACLTRAGSITRDNLYTGVKDSVSAYVLCPRLTEQLCLSIWKGVRNTERDLERDESRKGMRKDGTMGFD